GAEALGPALGDRRMPGLAAADLKPDAFASPAKHAELRALLAAYERQLASDRLADAADVYQEALRRLDVCPIRAADVTLELPGHVWAPLERRFLDALPGQRHRPRPDEPP